MASKTLETSKNKNHIRKTLQRPIGLAIAAVIVCVLFYTLGNPLERNNNLQEKLTASTAVDLSPKNETDVLCAEKHCTEGWQTKYGNFLEFEHEGEAEYWTTILGDESRRNGRIVLDMSGYENNIADKKLAIDTLFSEKDWS